MLFSWFLVLVAKRAGSLETNPTASHWTIFHAITLRNFALVLSVTLHENRRPPTAFQRTLVRPALIKVYLTHAACFRRGFD